MKREIQEGKDNDKGKDNNIGCNLKEYISSNLIDLKLYYNNQIKQGELYIEVLKDSQVMELAQKDAQVILFISTINNGKLV